MDPDAVKSTLSNLAFGNVMAAAARDYQKVPSFLFLDNFSLSDFMCSSFHRIEIMYVNECWLKASSLCELM